MFRKLSFALVFGAILGMAFSAYGQESKDATKKAAPEEKQAKEPAKNTKETTKETKASDTPASPKLSEDGTQKIKEGDEAAAQGKLTDAAVAYEAAKALDPNHPLPYLKAGQAYKDLKKFDLCVTNLEKLMEIGEGTGEAAEGQKVMDECKAGLKARIAKLHVKVQLEGATILVDGKEVGTSPVVELTLEPGKHEIVVEKAGYKKALQVITLQGGDTRKIELGLTPKPPDRVELTLAVNTDDAVILMDGLVVGASPREGPLLVEPGTHEFVVEKEGYITWSQKVDVGVTQTMELEANIMEKPEPPDMVGPWVGIGFGAALIIAGTVFGSSAGDDTQMERDDVRDERDVASIFLYTIGGVVTAGSIGLLAYNLATYPDDDDDYDEPEEGAGETIEGGGDDEKPLEESFLIGPSFGKDSFSLSATVPF